MDWQRNSAQTIRVALAVGTLCGIGLAAVSFLLYFLAQLFTRLLGGQVVAAMPPLWFLGYLGAGVAAGWRTKRVAAGVVAGVWGGCVGMALVLMGIVLAYGRVVSFFGGANPGSQYVFLMACAVVVGAVAGTTGSASTYFYRRSRCDERPGRPLRMNAPENNETEGH